MRPFRLSIPMDRAAAPRRVLADLLVRQGLDHPVVHDGPPGDTLATIWRENDLVCAALLLDAHDTWAPVASRHPSLAFSLELELRDDSLAPVRIEADKGFIPVLALEAAIARRFDGNAYPLHSLLAFLGRWSVLNDMAPGNQPSQETFSGRRSA